MCFSLSPPDGEAGTGTAENLRPYIKSEFWFLLPPIGEAGKPKEYFGAERHSLLASGAGFQ